MSKDCPDADSAPPEDGDEPRTYEQVLDLVEDMGGGIITPEEVGEGTVMEAVARRLEQNAQYLDSAEAIQEASLMLKHEPIISMEQRGDFRVPVLKPYYEWQVVKLHRYPEIVSLKAVYGDESKPGRKDALRELGKKIRTAYYENLVRDAGKMMGPLLSDSENPLELRTLALAGAAIARTIGEFTVWYPDLMDLWNRIREQSLELLARERLMMIRQKTMEFARATIDTKKEHYLEQIRSKMEYLQNIFSIFTGIDRDEFKSSAADDDDSSIGSITYGARMEMRQVPQQVLKQEMHVSEDNEMTLEMGDDLETMRERAKIVDWVTAHETGHVIAKSKKIDDHEPEAPAIVRQKTESYIDGIGLGLLYNAGTSNLDEKDPKDRVNTIVESFTATLRLTEKKFGGEESERSSARHLRMLTAGMKIRQIAESGDLPEQAENLARLLDQLREKISSDHKGYAGEYADAFEQGFQLPLELLLFQKEQ